MLQVYNYAASKDRNIGFRKDLWCLEGENTGRAEGGNKSIWVLLEDTGCHAVCGRTDRNTVFFLLNHLSTAFTDRENWQISLAVESDQDSYDVWRKMFAAFLVNHGEEVGYFAGCLSVQDGEAPCYAFDYLAYADHVRELPDAENRMDEFRTAVPGKDTSSWKKLYGLLQQLQDKSVKWCDELHLLVPEVTKDYFYRYCELELPGQPAVVIEKKDWKSLLNHEEPVNDHPEKENAGASERIAALVAAGIGIAIIVYRYIKHIRSRSKKGARKV